MAYSVLGILIILCILLLLAIVVATGIGVLIFFLVKGSRKNKTDIIDVQATEVKED